MLLQKIKNSRYALMVLISVALIFISIQLLFVQSSFTEDHVPVEFKEIVDKINVKTVSHLAQMEFIGKLNSFFETKNLINSNSCLNDKLNATIMPYNYRDWYWNKNPKNKPLKGCESYCFVTDKYTEADVIAFTAFNHPEINQERMPIKTSPTQIIAAVNSEFYQDYNIIPKNNFGKANGGFFSDAFASTLKKFFSWDFFIKREVEVVSNYNLDSDLPLLSIPKDYIKTYKDAATEILHGQEVPKFDDRKPATIIMTDCLHSWQINLYKLASEEFFVELPGECLNTMNMKKIGETDKEKIDYYSNFKMVILTESSLYSDYISRDFFLVLMAGSIPVYFGPHVAELFLPRPSSGINPWKFPTIESLLGHMNRLNTDKAEWAKYFEIGLGIRSPFGDLPLPPLYSETWDTLQNNLFKMSIEENGYYCRLCNCACSEKCSKDGNPGMGLSEMFLKINSKQDSSFLVENLLERFKL